MRQSEQERNISEFDKKRHTHIEGVKESKMKREGERIRRVCMRM